MDPGNWATDLEGGARFGYQLLWVLVLSNLMAILLQTLSARLGIVAQRDRVVGSDVTRRDGVHLHAVRGPFVGQRFGELADAALGRGISGHRDAALKRQQ